MSFVIINWRPNPKERRKFGLIMLIGCSLIGLAFQFLIGKADIAAAWYVFGAVSGGLGLTGTRAALPLYWVWMGVAFVLGNIISRVILALIYYLVVTPIGLVRRLAGHDDLHLRKPNRDSYWCDLTHQTGPSRYERQF